MAAESGLETAPDCNAAEQETALLASLADRCVKCGLCLPHCPTYGLSRNEGDSPRGRISLIQGLTAGKLEPSARLQHHLDTCLGCRACETVCPANVEFGRIMDSGRQSLRNRAPGYRPSALVTLFARPGGMRAARWLLAVARAARLPALARRLPGTMGRLAGLLGPESRSFRNRGSAAAGSVAGDDVLLFTGCVQSVVDGRTLEDTVAVLSAAGYRVRAPEGQVCCGALPGHAGDLAGARRMAERNIETFGSGTAPVVCLATGCTATLLEARDPAGKQEFAQRVTAVETLLLARLDRLDLKPVTGEALVHQPCTQRNVTGGFPNTLRLLQAIPELQVSPLAGNDRCCGAAGDHLLRHPDQASALAAPKTLAIRHSAARFVVTSNIGCALHLGRATGHTPPILHPVSLIARSLRGDSGSTRE